MVVEANRFLRENDLELPTLRIYLGSHHIVLRNNRFEQSQYALRFELPAAATVSLEIYDVLGRRVATLATGTLPEGSHTVTWDAGAFPSGVYACRLQAGTQTHTRLLLLRK